MTYPDILSIAPMIQWTDRHWRFYFRQISRCTLLYTEMVLDDALNYNPTRLESFIGHKKEEEPLVVQLGGCDPEKLGKAASLCENFGNFHAINLNAGCPSNRAKKAGFGAELMLDSELVRKITYSMIRQASNSEITVKCRLGVTNKESWEDLVQFVAACKSSGVNKMIIHARVCILKGLSPAQNRNIPPLQYDKVHQLIQEFPDMNFILNGGIESFSQAKHHLGEQYQKYFPEYIDSVDSTIVKPGVYGIMIGREAYHHPFHFLSADNEFFTSQYQLENYPQSLKERTRDEQILRWDVMEKYLEYAEEAQCLGIQGSNTCNIIKPMHNHFHGYTTNSLYKQKLDYLLIKYSKLIDSQQMKLSELILQAIEDTIPTLTTKSDISDLY